MVGTHNGCRNSARSWLDVARLRIWPCLFGLLAGCWASVACAQPSLHEVEPNDTPAEATDFTGAATLIGSMHNGDQDGYRWTVSDVDAQKRWTFELQGIPGQLTVVDVIQVEYADNGVDVAATRKLFTMGTRDGSKPSVHEDLLFEPGEYLLGVAHGGAGSFRPPAANAGFDSLARDEAATATEPGGYRLIVREGNWLPVAGPRQSGSQAAAHQLRHGDEDTAYFDAPASWYQFEITDADAEKVWELSGQVPVGRELAAVLVGADSVPLAKAAADGKGKFSLPDLGLDAGTYYVELVGEDAGYIRSLSVFTVGQCIAGAEAEPNDTHAAANRADLAQPVTGRMGVANENDYFLFDLDEAAADQVLTLALTTADGVQIQLCLTDHQGRQVQCRSGKGIVELPGLVLHPGSWGFVVGRAAQGTEYTVELRVQGAILQGTEAEPNDRIEHASAVPANNRIKGRFSGTDTDFYKIIVTDEPQLWRFQVSGDELFELAYYDGAGIQNQVFRVPAGQKRIRLDNVFLLPGIHHVRVSGRDGGSYTLLARAMGVPDPNGEIEPNDDSTRMQPLQFEQTRTGLLADPADRDNYRFRLGAWDRIRLTLLPPADGALLAHLLWDKSSFKQFNAPEIGQPVILEGLFPPGEYRLELSARTVSDAEYRISLERLPRFGCASDCEPNDNLDFANPLPRDQVLEGRTNEWRDLDWYQMPVFEEATRVILESESKLQVKLVSADYAAPNLLEWDNERREWQGTIPAALPTYLQIGTYGDYRLEVRFPEHPLPAPESAGAVVLDLKLEADEVAAYHPQGQQVAGRLTLRNEDAAPLVIDLDSATSDYRWQVALEQTSIAVPAGGELSIPLAVTVPADAWADRPVRISIRAVSQGGAASETYADVAAGRDAPAVALQPGWALPEPLLGGFNVAAKALGGRWLGEEDSAIGAGFGYLFDGMAVEDQGLVLRGSTAQHTVEVTVELAGGEPVEVAGFVVNQLGGTYASRYLRNADISLSLDGESFTPVVSGELLPIKAEQTFVLDEPLPARFARLTPRRAFDGLAGPALGLGEFKVIAVPGYDLSAKRGFNLADPSLGGHVVWSRPAITASGWDDNLLIEDGRYDHTRVRSGQQLDWVIGFHHDRAAEISRFEWVDAAASGRITRVQLSTSTDSPVGPWEPLAEWQLDDGQTPSVLQLDQPTWARFVRFTVAGPDGQQTHALPDAIRIWERPTSADYRSVLTEWGFASQAAYYEARRPLLSGTYAFRAGHDTRAAAADLQFDRTVAGQVALGRHVHWYRLTAPQEDNLLTVMLGGDPTVRTVVELETGDGAGVPMRRKAGEGTPHLHLYEAQVEPGGSYYLKVEEPPRNVAFIWDTSASVGAYLPVIYSALMAYAEDLEPGRDAANLMPFGGDLLLKDWYGEPYILQTVLNEYPRKESSSEAERTLSNAAAALAPLAGTKAIVVITDAGTTRYAPVWTEFERVQPRVFGLGVGSQGVLGRNPPREQDLMQDWSRVNGGHYAYLHNEGEMEVAFDRAQTMLRRPAGYTITALSSYREAPGPGSLRVVSSGSPAAAAGGAIELILDASGSMLKRLDGKRRISIAKEVLSEAVSEHIPKGTPVALRVFGHKEPNACRTDLELPLAPLDSAAALRAIEAVEAKNLAKTPIAESLAAIEADLAGTTGRIVVVLVTDGEETCDGDPAAVIQTLESRGIEISLNIVGFAIGDSELEQQFQGWAQAGNGRYFSADDQAGLSRSLQDALKVPFTVYDRAGTIAGEGLVDGEPLDLQQGYYRVVVKTAPARTFDKVEVVGGQAVALEADAP